MQNLVVMGCGRYTGIVRMRFSTLAFGIAVLFGLLTLFPYAVHMTQPEFQGLTVIRDKDYGNYYSRLERVLDGHPEEADNGITAIGSAIEGMQSATAEVIVGSIFKWTGLSAPTLSVILTAIFTSILFLLLLVFLGEIGFARAWSIGIAVVLFLVMFPTITRMPHPGWTFIPAIGALLATFMLWKRPSIPLLVVAGILLGLLPSLYFWHWMWVWASVATLLLLTLFAKEEDRYLLRHPAFSALGGGLILLIALPFLLHTAELMQSPLYPEIAVRASFLYERTPESWPRTILLLIQCITFATLWRDRRQDRSYLIVFSLLLGVLFVMHQNVLHAKVLMFASHFEPHLIISSVIAGAWVLTRRVDFIRRGIITLIALAFLAGGAYDYFPLNSFFFVVPGHTFRDQHLAEPIAILRELPPATVLTDKETGRLLTAWTHHGIVYTTHSRFLFISDADMADRFCMSELFSEFPDPYRSLYIEYNDVLDSPEMRERERSLVTEACMLVRAEPVKHLREYDVRYILENTKDRPDWRADTDLPSLSQIGTGSGWTLWEVSR